MKTFSLIWSIFVIALILFVCALQIIDYRIADLSEFRDRKSPIYRVLSIATLGFTEI